MNEEQEKFLEQVYILRDVRMASEKCGLSGKQVREMFRNLDFLSELVNLLNMMKWEATIVASKKARNGDIKAADTVMKFNPKTDNKSNQKLVVGVLNTLFDELPDGK